MSHNTENNDHDHEHEQDKSSNRPKIERDSKYWLSLEQYEQDPEFMKLAETEFQSSPLRESDGEDGWARREFLKLMGASIAMASTSCIRRPVQKIVPYNKQPEELTLGVINRYATTFSSDGEGLGLLVRCREGRPLKIEGNPEFPLNKGGVSSRAQASILSLYDPERLKNPVRNLLNEGRSNYDSVAIKWEDLDKSVVEQLKKGDVVVVTGTQHSPTARALTSDFIQAFKANHIVWEPLSHEELREGQKLSYGEDIVPSYRFDKAQLIVSVDADFLGSWLSPIAFAKQFAQGRSDFSKMNKLVVFDSNYSLTGANADVRVKIKPSMQLAVVMGLLHELIIKKGLSSYAVHSGVKSALASYSDVANKLGLEADVLSKLAEDLWNHKGKSLVVAGGLPTLTTESQNLQSAVNFLNNVLENDGKTIDSKAGNAGLQGSSSSVIALIDAMKAGKVKTLILHRVNLAYALPSSLGFQEAIKKVEMVIYAGDRVDETGKFAHYVATDNHPLESWGDAEYSRGIFAISQPTIRPLYDTRAFELSLMSWAFIAKQGPKRIQSFETYYDYLRNFWKEEIYPKVGKGKDFEAFWVGLLQEGFVGNQSEDSHSSRTFKVDSFLSSVIPFQGASAGMELVLYPNVMMGDGQLNNISWLYELPDPVTRIVWDNFASVSVGAAKKMGLVEGSIVELSVGGKKLDLPVHIQPGLHDEVVAVAVGYGRTRSGKVANGIGKNAYELVDAVKGRFVYSGGKSSLVKKEGLHVLACVQAHHSMEGRQIVIEATLKDYQKSPNANVHRHKTWSIWSGHQYNGHKWGMAVDLNTCTGCSACMIACQSENNIPVVGKKYVLQGREMHWIRVDRYYTGTPENAEVVFQPVMCQHCDNAPCETVCPVLATVHSDEGLNDMSYNRCVGTRYCSNNCPYKVRRFNWFNFNANIDKPLHLALNPDVTTRPRGVMEKCTFCVHRIKAGKNLARQEGRKLQDGDIKTACQSACPSNAIVFGDINDKTSAVSKMFHDDPRSYALLEEWNAAPSVRYLSKIRNNGKVTAPHEGHETSKTQPEKLEKGHGSQSSQDRGEHS